MDRRDFFLGLAVSAFAIWDTTDGVTARKRTQSRYGIPRAPHGCTIQIIWEDTSAYARCKGGKFAEYNPNSRNWTVHRRRS